MMDSQFPSITSILINMESNIVCSNINRVKILYLLKNSPRNELQVEKMAYILGLSHRTILYHLDFLADYDLVEVRKFRRRGKRFMRSVWGLNRSNAHLYRIFSDIEKRFNIDQLRQVMSGS